MPGLREDQIAIKWELRPGVQPGKTDCLINGDFRKEFSLNSDCLRENQQYTVSSKIVFNNQQQVIWSGSV